VTRRPIPHFLILTALVATFTVSGCKGKKMEQLRADSVAAEGDLFIWAATVVRLQADSTKGGSSSGPDLTNQALQRARARLKEAYDRRTATDAAMGKLR
jgi:hypothetical protein